MSNPLRQWPGWSTLVLTVIGYATVIGTLYSSWFEFLYPSIGRETVNVLSHLIAANNTVTVLCLGLGWYWIRRDNVDKHSTAMSTAFGLIILFLVMYLVKTGGGGRKEFVGPAAAWWPYVIMLGTHILLSILSVPVVLYTLILGTTKPITKIRQSLHPTIGRIAAGTWLVSLVLGVLAYILLHHVYSFEFIPA